jgi:hypothetical protein
VTLHGRSAGPFVVHDAPDGSITEVFRRLVGPSRFVRCTGFRIAGDAIAEHDAVRDDLDMAKQAGWIPPTPGYIIKMRSARRRARKAQAV